MLREIVHFVAHAPEVMRMQRGRSHAEFMDRMMAMADAQGFAEERRELVGDLRGRVLEVGCGAGTMFEHYAPGADVEAVEPDAELVALAEAKAHAAAARVHVAKGDGMHLAFDDRSFDAVVLGLVLCSVPSMSRVLEEARRVLVPGGLLRALDHVRSERAVPGLLMDVTNPLWMRLNQQGCRWNRDPVRAIEDAGFRVDDVRAFQRFDTIMPAFPMRRVRARGP